MNKKYLNTLIALAIFAAMWGAFSYVGRKKSPKKKASATAKAQHIFPVARGHITSVTFLPSGAKAITCARQGAKWVITRPLKLAADSSAIDGFLNSLVDLVPSEVVDNHPTSLKDFGLDPPRETIDVTTDSKPARFTLLLGDSTPTNDGIYAQVKGQPRVMTLASAMKTSLEKNLFDLRNKQVTTLKSSQIDRIVVTSKSSHYTLVKNPEGVWDLMLPPAVRADHFTVEGLVDELGTASMQSVVAESKRNLGKYGLLHPSLTLHLSGPGVSQTLLVGKATGSRYYAMNNALDPVFTLGTNFVSQFQKTASDLRSKDLFTFSTFSANQVTVNGPKGRRVFVRKKGKWSQTSPKNKIEDSSKVESLVDSLRDLNATSFPQKHPTDLAAYGLTKPLYTFQVQYGKKNQTQTQTVELAKADGHYYARRSTDLVPSEISKDAFNAAVKALGAL